MKRKKFNFYLLSGILSSALLVGGCAVSQSYLIADSSGYPTSMGDVALSDAKSLDTDDKPKKKLSKACLLYTSDAADDR